MLPVRFLPLPDEMPVSWMNRLAIANGFNNVNQMLFYYRITKSMSIKQHSKYLNDLIYIYESDTKKALPFFTMYKHHLNRYKSFIRNLDTDHILICPDCMKEEFDKYGCFTYHLQHQQAMSYSCWKHKCCLYQIAASDYLIQDSNKIQISSLYSFCDTSTERDIINSFYEPARMFYLAINYYLNILLHTDNISINNINSEKELLSALIHNNLIFDDEYLIHCLFQLIKNQTRDITFNDEKTKYILNKLVCIDSDMVWLIENAVQNLQVKVNQKERNRIRQIGLYTSRKERKDGIQNIQ